MVLIVTSLQMDFKIEHTWDGFPVKHEPVFIRLNPGDRGVMMDISAPFFNDPPAPLGEPGKPFNELWDCEVVEAFFLNDVTEQYLEVELCPHGQHLVLLLSGRRNVWKQELPLSFRVSRGETKWEGKAYLPWSYFPPNVTKFNSFAIHGSEDQRSYEALYPVPQHELQQGQKPDLVSLCHPGWSAVAQSQLTAASTSWGPGILLPQKDTSLPGSCLRTGGSESVFQ
ncbi:UPF0462 protein C4orf33 homolog isoform X2 [Symphalangus syndactylus]|uniref:UPF0462 protein C4orf33 homolog isoform X2 n=1 Tax=Symphalangus syndactylus TaxID=9590 RepID=UPI002442FDF6|nr:UPF0462 protein C4orf33 homolog isoform X3 [Symphalangus syndactylus]